MHETITLNKLQHKYIQNLQRANMTLKCRVKEASRFSAQLEARWREEDEERSKFHLMEGLGEEGEDELVPGG